MIFPRLAPVLLFALIAMPALADSFSLKEFTIGAPMAECPLETNKTKTASGLLVCTLGTTTLANQPVRSVDVYLYQGKVVGATYELSAKGQYANGEVLAALLEKLGPPTEQKSRLNHAVWFKGANQIMLFDGWGGTVGMMDQSEAKAALQSASSRNKSDL